MAAGRNWSGGSAPEQAAEGAGEQQRAGAGLLALAGDVDHRQLEPVARSPGRDDEVAGERRTAGRAERGLDVPARRAGRGCRPGAGSGRAGRRTSTRPSRRRRRAGSGAARRPARSGTSAPGCRPRRRCARSAPPAGPGDHQQREHVDHEPRQVSRGEQQAAEQQRHHQAGERHVVGRDERPRPRSPARAGSGRQDLGVLVGAAPREPAHRVPRRRARRRPARATGWTSVVIGVSLVRVRDVVAVTVRPATGIGAGTSRTSTGCGLAAPGSAPGSRRPGTARRPGGRRRSGRGAAPRPSRSSSVRCSGRTVSIRPVRTPVGHQRDEVVPHRLPAADPQAGAGPERVDPVPVQQLGPVDVADARPRPTGPSAARRSAPGCAGSGARPGRGRRPAAAGRGRAGRRARRAARASGARRRWRRAGRRTTRCRWPSACTSRSRTWPTGRGTAAASRCTSKLP